MFNVEVDKEYILFTDTGGQFTIKIAEFSNHDMVVKGLNLSHPEATFLQVDLMKCVAICILTETDLTRLQEQNKRFTESWDKYQDQQAAPHPQNYM